MSNNLVKEIVDFISAANAIVVVLSACQLVAFLMRKGEMVNSKSWVNRLKALTIKIIKLHSKSFHWLLQIENNS